VIVKEAYDTYDLLHLFDNEMKVLIELEVLDPKWRLHLPLYHFEMTKNSAICVCQKAPMDLFAYYENLRKLNVPNISLKLSYHSFCLTTLVIQLHNLGRVHNDIKPENVVCCDEEATKLALIDFGESLKVDSKCSKHINTTKPHKFDRVPFGTPGFQLPSIMRNQSSNLFAHDIWCLLMTILTLFTNATLYRECGNEAFQWQNAILQQRWSKTLLVWLPHLKDDILWIPFVDFIDRLCDASKVDFPCATNELLQHEFLQAWKLK
jgi:serine/threonine protein kinase